MPLEIISLHIPKTAGTSFLASLKEIYGKEAVLHVKRKEAIEYSGRFVELLKPRTKVLHGHFHFNEVKNLINPGVKCITWLRNPAERVISNYYYFKKRLNEQKHLPGANRINESLEAYAFLENSRNRMCSFLSGSNPAQFFFVGIMENYQKELEFLSRKMNWPKTAQYKLNSNPGSRDVKTETLNLIEALNKQDMKLYADYLKISADSVLLYE